MGLGSYLHIHISTTVDVFSVIDSISLADIVPNRVDCGLFIFQVLLVRGRLSDPDRSSRDSPMKEGKRQGLRPPERAYQQRCPAAARPLRSQLVLGSFSARSPVVLSSFSDHYQLSAALQPVMNSWQATRHCISCIGAARTCVLPHTGPA